MQSEILVVFEDEDRVRAVDVAARVESAIDDFSRSLRFNQDQQPGIRVLTYSELPEERLLDPLSIVIAVLPKKGWAFTADVVQRLKSYLEIGRRGEGLRVIPLACENERVWSPEPLSPLVAAHLFDMSDAAAMSALVARALILMSLLTVGDMGIFISYRQADGLPLAKALYARLKKRGYKVWRDDEPDRDGGTLLGSGNVAQEKIAAAIEEHGFVLLLDTPQASGSGWVQEEVDLATGRLFPILPVVVTADPDESSSRFRQVSGFTVMKLGDSALNPAKIEALLDARMDELENTIARVALRDARTRRRLSHDSRHAFVDLQYGWSVVPDRSLLFVCERDLDDHRSPGLKLRMLVLCCPYRRISTDQLDLLEKNFDAWTNSDRQRFQFGILMHNSAVPSADLPKLIRGASHLLITEPSKVGDLFAKHRL
jgi:TIR domain